MSLPPLLALIFEPDGLRHELGHQARSLAAIWLYTMILGLSVHALSEITVRYTGRWPTWAHVAVLMAATALLAVIVTYAFAPLLSRVCPGLVGAENALAARGVLVSLIYVAGALLYARLERRAREASLQAEQERRARVEATLHALAARTQPHFMANALNTVAGCVADDPELGQRLLVAIANLLRYSLAAKDRRTVAVADELAAVQEYLDVQVARFGARLRTHVDVDPLARDERIPPMVLLCIVENAVLHGLSTGRDVEVELRGEVTPDALVLRVTDTGPGPGASRHRGSGTGLDEARQRLALVAGEASRIDVAARMPGPTGSGGTEVRIVLPRDEAVPCAS